MAEMHPARQLFFQARQGGLQTFAGSDARSVDPGLQETAEILCSFVYNGPKGELRSGAPTCVGHRLRSCNEAEPASAASPDMSASSIHANSPCSSGGNAAATNAVGSGFPRSVTTRAELLSSCEAVLPIRSLNETLLPHCSPESEASAIADTRILFASRRPLQNSHSSPKLLPAGKCFKRSGDMVAGIPAPPRPPPCDGKSPAAAPGPRSPPLPVGDGATGPPGGSSGRSHVPVTTVTHPSEQTGGGANEPATCYPSDTGSRAHESVPGRRTGGGCHDFRTEANASNIMDGRKVTGNSGPQGFDGAAPGAGGRGGESGDDDLFTQSDMMGRAGELVALGRELVLRLVRVQSTKANLTQLEEVLQAKISSVRRTLMDLMQQHERHAACAQQLHLHHDSSRHRHSALPCAAAGVMGEPSCRPMLMQPPLLPPAPPPLPVHSPSLPNPPLQPPCHRRPSTDDPPRPPPTQKPQPMLDYDYQAPNWQERAHRQYEPPVQPWPHPPAPQQPPEPQPQRLPEPRQMPAPQQQPQPQPARLWVPSRQVQPPPPSPQPPLSAPRQELSSEGLPSRELPDKAAASMPETVVRADLKGTLRLLVSSGGSGREVLPLLRLGLHSAPLAPKGLHDHPHQQLQQQHQLQHPHQFRSQPQLAPPQPHHRASELLVTYPHHEEQQHYASRPAVNQQAQIWVPEQPNALFEVPNAKRRRLPINVGATITPPSRQVLRSSPTERK